MVLWKSICYIFQHNCQKYYPQHRSNLLFWNLSHFVSFVILQNIYWKIYWNINKIFIARLINIEFNFVTFVLFLFCWKLIMIWLQFLDYEIRQIWFLNSTEKVKPGFLLSLMCMFPESNSTKLWSHSFQLQNSGILQTRMNQRGNPIKINFDILQIQKWISQTVRAQKINEKIGSFPSWVGVLKLSKIVHFLYICANLSKKSKSLKAIYLHSSQSYTLHIEPKLLKLCLHLNFSHCVFFFSKTDSRSDIMFCMKVGLLVFSFLPLFPHFLFLFNKTFNVFNRLLS